MKESPEQLSQTSLTSLAAAFRVRLDAVNARVASACARSGRDCSSLRIMAVSKTRSVEEIAAAADAGMRLFGENRVKEAMEKKAAFFEGRPDLSLHMIGNLQSNKARDAARSFDCVQSVGSAELLALLDRKAAEAGKVLDVFFELHTGEESKAGFSDPDSLLKALEASSSLKAVRPLGLMTMAPFTEDGGRIRASFRALAALRGPWSALRPDLPCPLLSMGMSNDFEIAVEEGADILRLGTILFGEARP